MNVTRTEEGGLIFLCWRASCDVRGAVGGSPVRLASLVNRREKFVRTKPDPSSRLLELYDGEIGYRDINLGDWALTYVNLNDFGVKYDPETRRLALPVYSPVGLVRGWVLRAMDRATTPKTLAIPTLPETQLGWNLYQKGSGDVIVVEDIPSAIRLGEFGVRAVALNSTHMTDEACEELAAEAERVVFALDRDAIHKSVALDKKLRLHFDKTAVLLLPKDFKNQTNEEVRSCLSEISWLVFSDPEKPSTE